MPTIDCGIGTINYTTENSLDIVTLMENLDAAIQKHGVKKVSEFIIIVDDKYKNAADELITLQEKYDEETGELQAKVEELEESLESNEGLTLIDLGYGNLWWKSDNLNAQSIMEEINKKHGIGEMDEA